VLSLEENMKNLENHRTASTLARIWIKYPSTANTDG